MAVKKIVIFFSLACYTAVIVADNGGSKAALDHIQSGVNKNDAIHYSTTTEVTNTVTPTKPATTESPTKPTMTEPPHTTPKPITTPKPAPTPAPTPSPTPAPTPSPTPAPTPSPSPAPTPAPTPVSPPEEIKWVWPVDNATCIILQWAVQMNVSYTTKDEKMAHAVFNLKKNGTTVNGTCGNITQSITLSWNSSTGLDNKLEVVFEKNTTLNRYYISHIHASLVRDELVFPNISGLNNQTVNLSLTEKAFDVPLPMSYRCAREQKLNFTGDANATMIVSHLQEQAFHTEKGNSFGAASDCETSDVPDVVPIVVGCVLGGLVLVVLVAYLVSRRRSQARGYLSM